MGPQCPYCRGTVVLQVVVPGQPQQPSEPIPVRVEPMTFVQAVAALVGSSLVILQGCLAMIITVVIFYYLAKFLWF